MGRQWFEICVYTGGHGLTDSFAGRVVLVTGAARGIGRAAAGAFATRGAVVFSADIELPKPADASHDIVSLVTDVTAPEDVESAFTTIEDRTAGVDVLVNNAGILYAAPFAGVSRVDWNRVERVNLEAMFFLSQRAAATMRRRGGGAIVNIASTSAFVTSPEQTVYEVTKAAVSALTRSLAVELIPWRIRVNAVAPGLIDTDMTRSLFGTPERMAARVAEKVPLGRAGTAGDVADAIVFLASPNAEYVVGQTLVVDGGWLLM